MPDERLPRLEERMKALIDRTADLTRTVEAFRTESGEQHTGLSNKIDSKVGEVDVKVDAVVAGIATEKEAVAARRRTAALAFSAPTLGFLLAILYKLVGG